LFIEASPLQAHLVQAIFDSLCAASGRLAPKKSSMFSSQNTGAQVMNHIIEILQMPMVDDFGKYLGISTLKERVTRATYHEVLDIIDKRLVGGTAKCLSPAG